MESLLFRTGSRPITSSWLPVSLPLRHGSFSSCEKLDFSPLLHLEVYTNRQIISGALSEPQPINRLRSISSGSQSFPEMLPEVEEELLPDDDIVGRIGSLEFAARCFDKMSLFPANGPDRDGFGPGGNNSNSNSNSNSNGNEQNKIGAHYKKMLKLEPNDPLLLRNYSKFLHEVEGDIEAEEYYGRAILANRGDGELLSLYGKLIWDTQRDGERAKSYFDQAVIASPDDCMVMGSYAKFMWEAEDEEEETGYKVLVSGSQPLVAAF